MDTTEKTLYTAILISAGIIGFVLFYFAYTVYKGRMNYFRMLARNLVAEMEVLERERTRMARDLHDELGPLLAVTKIQIEQAEVEHAATQQKLKSAAANILKVMERSGEIARNLTPRILTDKGLRIALEDFIEQFNEAGTMKIKLVYCVQQELKEFYALQLYRIVQELVHNAVKHSGGSAVEIFLKEYRKKVYLIYTDNGKGLDASLFTKECAGLGLSSLQNRAALLGGKMTIHKPQRKGTELVFEIPL